MSQRKKNILQRLLVILVLLVSIGLFAWLCLEVWHIKTLAENLGVHFTNQRGKLTELDNPVQKLVFIFAGWLVLQVVFFIGLLRHFFSSTRNDSERGSRRAETQRSRHYDLDKDDDNNNDEATSRRRHRSEEKERDEDEDPSPRHREESPKRRPVSTDLDFDDKDKEDKPSETIKIELNTPNSVADSYQDEDYLEVPKPVGRRSRKDRR